MSVRSPLLPSGTCLLAKPELRSSEGKSFMDILDAKKECSALNRLTPENILQQVDRRWVFPAPIYAGLITATLIASMSWRIETATVWSSNSIDRDDGRRKLCRMSMIFCWNWQRRKSRSFPRFPCKKAARSDSMKTCTLPFFREKEDGVSMNSMMTNGLRSDVCSGARTWWGHARYRRTGPGCIRR